MAIASVPSRFSLLNIDDDDDNEKKETQRKPSKWTEQQSKKKKPKKQQNPEQVAAEQNQLRNLAFGPGGKGKKKGGGGGQTSTKEAPQRQWDQWKKMDDESTQESYEKDLEHALLQSRLQFKDEEKTKKEEAVASQAAKDKKKKKKDKTMTLEKFNQMVEEGKDPSQDSDEPTVNGRKHGKAKAKETPEAGDGKFFVTVTEDVDKILQKEKIQEVYKKQYAVENTRTQQYEKQLDKKEKEVTMLKDSSKKMATELAQVKKRNQQLCHILAQGEMKDKTAVLLELEDLKLVRDELTEEVGELTSQLEKEKSKNHALKSEIDKLKTGKHK